MKLFATLCAACCGLTMMGEGLDYQVTRHDVVVPDGVTVEIGYTKPNENLPRYQWDADLYLEALADTDIALTCSSPEGKGWQCCAGGNCVAISPSSPAEKTLVLDQGDKENLQIETMGMYKEALPETNLAYLELISSEGEYKITISALPVSAEQVGIKTIASNGNYVQVINRRVNYNFAAPTAMTVYSIDGKAVASYCLNATGSLDVNIPAGVYVYRAGNVSGKMLVK